MRDTKRSTVCGAWLVALALLMLPACSRPAVVVVGPADAEALDVPDVPHFWDPIPVSPSTTAPERIADGYWRGQFERVNREVAAADGPGVVFFGDSITKGWTLLQAVGEPVWQERYAPLNAINMGNSGDITPVMLYRVTHGNLDFPEGHAPRVAVLLCGTNNYVVMQSDGGNVRWDLGIDTPPGEVADGVRAIAQAFRRELPETRVIVLGILPVRNAAKQQRVEATNAALAALAYNADEVVYLDLSDRFTQADGSLNDALYTDGTHLTEAGYRVWADAIDPVIQRMMDAPALEPVRITMVGGIAPRTHMDQTLRRQGLLIDLVDAGPADIAVVQVGLEVSMDDLDHTIASLREDNGRVGIVLSRLIPDARRDDADTLTDSVYRYAVANTTGDSPIVVADLVGVADFEQRAGVYSAAIHRLLEQTGHNP